MDLTADKPFINEIISTFEKWTDDEVQAREAKVVGKVGRKEATDI